MFGATAVHRLDINHWTARPANQTSTPDDRIPKSEDYMVIKSIPDCRDL